MKAARGAFATAVQLRPGSKRVSVMTGIRHACRSTHAFADTARVDYAAGDALNTEFMKRSRSASARSIAMAKAGRTRTASSSEGRSTESSTQSTSAVALAVRADWSTSAI